MAVCVNLKLPSTDSAALVCWTLSLGRPPSMAAGRPRPPPRPGPGPGSILLKKQRMLRPPFCSAIKQKQNRADENSSSGAVAASKEGLDAVFVEAKELAESVSGSGRRKMKDSLSVRAAKRKAERYAYLFAAMASSAGITSMAAAAVYYRFVWQTQGREVPYGEMLGTFSLAVGATVGMEYWARWAHRALWHASLWHMHESHHRPREGPFELNDVFAIINAVPAIALLAYGFFNQGLFPGLCFGAGLGITTFGMAYMFVHDGLVHRRFPVGPIADVPYLRKVAAAHQLHHADKFDGVPYGLFLGPKEVEEVGGLEELEKLLNSKNKPPPPAAAAAAKDSVKINV